MASAQKISELTTAGPLTGAELVPIVQNGGTLQTTVSVLKMFSVGNIENEVSALDARIAAVSILATQDAEAIASIQTDLGDLTIRVADVSASVFSLNVRMAAVEASVSAINSALAAIDVSALAVLEPRVSALEIRVGLVSAAVSVNTAAITSINVVVADVSARTSVNAAAITSINNVVSVQGVRLEAVSAANVSLAFSVSILDTRVSALEVRVTGVSASVSSLQVQLNVVSAAVVSIASAVIPASRGGTGATTLTANNVLLGNGVNAVQTVAPGTSGNVLTSNGTTWLSQPSSGGGGGLPLTGGTLTGPLIVDVSSASAAVRITQTGSGNALVVEDSANPDATPFIIDQAGAVGIGGTPTVRLETFGESNNWVRINTAAGAALFSGYRSNGTIASKTIVSSGDQIARFDARGYDGANFIQAAQINAEVDGAPGTNDMPGRLVFSTTADGASSPTERMRITNAGNVGIGTASPIVTLDLNAATYCALQTSSGGVQAQFASNSGGTVDVRAVSNHPMTFRTNNTERMRIDASGNVGIGTSSPSVRLDVNGSINGTWAGATIAVANGGTGATTLTGLVVGNGTSAFTTVTAPAGAVVGTTDTQTITNKRVNPRIGTVASAATITPTADTSDQYNVTALATAATIAAPSGTPVDGQRLVLRFEDNGTGRALTWTTSSGAYRAVGVTLPTTTVANRVTYVGCIYNAQDVFWDVVAAVTQA